MFVKNLQSVHLLSRDRTAFLLIELKLKVKKVDFNSMKNAFYRLPVQRSANARTPMSKLHKFSRSFRLLPIVYRMKALPIIAKNPNVMLIKLINRV
jgi:hypothetical protein